MKHSFWRAMPSAGRGRTRSGSAESTFSHRLGMLLVATLAVTGAGLGGVSAANATPETDSTPPAVAPASGDAQAPGAPMRALAAVPGVATTTEASLWVTPSTYGNSLALSVTVTPAGASFFMGAPVLLEVDGVQLGEGVLLYVGDGKFWAIVPATTLLSAGTHQVVAKFPGYSSGIPGIPDALPSESAPITVTVAAATTTTTITSSPATTTAFTPIDVAAKVTGGPAGVSGNASLLADNVPVATQALGADGTVLFEDVIVPFGTPELSVAYLGDDGGDYKVSVSPTVAIRIDEVATETSLSLSKSRARAGDPVTFVATVRNTSGANLVDPRSGIEILVDGDVVYTEVSSDDGDASPGDGVTQFEVTLSDTLLGEHTATARFLPAPGFEASESDEIDLQVDGIDTVLTPAAAELRGTPKHPAIATVDVTKVPAPDVNVTRSSVQALDAALPTDTGAPVDGYVQAFLGDEPVGDPILVEDGAGTGPIAGLPIGTHEVELRFTAGTYGMFSSSATVSVTVTADAAVAPAGNGGKPALSATGSGDVQPFALVALGLMVSAGLLLTLARRRRSA
ncbi:MULTISPECIES: Ig-like domain repeat protein [unclassified Leucobacter]|uniref:Ig-like domain repeat protein n=1 Tax=unclassified Leucobacter TaxID=2621730 RepID=UPI00165DCB4F|nr:MULTISPECIES: Ig-like domain repeat protein [unclassified Leucobacter]MBC9937040.1 Ig-like domain repeat protein [Leucobacter sp. cx-87]